MVSCIHGNLHGLCDFCDHQLHPVMTNEPAPAMDVAQENPFQWPIDANGSEVAV